MIIMKKYTKSFVFILLILQFFGCDNSKSIEVHQAFPENMWDRFEIIELEAIIDQINIDYDLYLRIKHDSSYPFDSLYINLITYLPSGEIRVNEYTFDMKDKNGAFLTELSGGIGEQLFLLRESFKFHEPGILKVEIECLIPRPEINGVQSIGIVLEEVKANK